MDEIVLSFKDEDAANEFDYYFRDAWGSECDTEVKGTKVTIIPTGFFDVDELKKLLRTEWNTAEWPFTIDKDCCESCDAAKETKAQRAMRVAETENGRKFRSKRIENKKKKAPRYKDRDLEESVEAGSDFESQVWLELCDMCQEEGLPSEQIFSKYGYLVDEADEEGISDPQEVAYSMLKTWEVDCAKADGFEDGRYPSFSEMNDTVYESTINEEEDGRFHDKPYTPTQNEVDDAEFLMKKMAQFADRADTENQVLYTILKNYKNGHYSEDDFNEKVENHLNVMKSLRTAIGNIEEVLRDLRVK